MDYFLSQVTRKRIGEIAIISPPSAAQGAFIRAVCPKVSTFNQDVIFGHREFSPELALFVYGIKTELKSQDFAWDLIAHKMIGFIILFDWYDEQSFEISKNILDSMIRRLEAPILLAADVRDRPFPVKRQIYQNGVSLEFRRSLTFCSSTDKKSVQNVFASLLNSVVHQIS